MYHVPVYLAEQEAGLEQLIKTTASVSLANTVRLCDKQQLSDKAIAALQNLNLAKAALGDADIHFLNTILVTTGWNNNDDVFDPMETWLAKASPVYKPFNFEHVGTDIIGTTISCTPIDVDGKSIADDILADALPNKFHLLNGDVIWKYWENQEKQERMDKTIAEIAKGEWFVSMECLFRGFDYALKGPNGTCRVLARTDKTAFLSKHLRVYGGAGTYNEYKVGRLLRNILFSGKGLVRNPANPESTILNLDTPVFVATASEILKENIQDSENGVYSTNVQPIEKRNSTMAVELSDLQKQIDTLKTENETLKASLKENDIKSLQAKIDALTSDLAKANEVVAVKTTLEAEVVSLKASTESLTKDLADTQEELKKIYAEQEKKDRLSKIVAALKIDTANAENVKAAEELNASLADLSKDKFEAYLNTQAKFSAAPLPPKASPLPTAPLVSGLPAPMAGKASEIDPAEAAADTKVLETAVASKEAAMTVPAPDNVKTLAKSVAACFGIADDETK